MGNHGLFFAFKSGTKRWNKEVEQGAAAPCKNGGEGSPKAKGAFLVPFVPLFAFLVPPKKSIKSRVNDHNGTKGTKGTRKIKNG